METRSKLDLIREFIGKIGFGFFERCPGGSSINLGIQGSHNVSLLIYPSDYSAYSAEALNIHMEDFLTCAPLGVDLNRRREAVMQGDQLYFGTLWTEEEVGKITIEAFDDEFATGLKSSFGIDSSNKEKKFSLIRQIDIIFYPSERTVRKILNGRGSSLSMTLRRDRAGALA